MFSKFCRSYLPTCKSRLVVEHLYQVLFKYTVFQLENEKGRAPGRALFAKWAREGTF